MLRKNILAHRGWWRAPEERNSQAALFAALDAGFGIETDIRDLGGELVISHDPPEAAAPLTAERFLDYYAKSGSDGLLALNIKADGLSGRLAEVIAATGAGMANVFVFDMSIPDTLGYLKLGTPFYTRLSEYEPIPPLVERAAGIWLDNFTGRFEQVNKALEHLDKGHSIAFVSPELHGRDHRAMWQDIRRRDLHRRNGFSLCTDFPSEAVAFFGAAND